MNTIRKLKSGELDYGVFERQDWVNKEGGQARLSQGDVKIHDYPYSGQYKITGEVRVPQEIEYFDREIDDLVAPFQYRTGSEIFIISKDLTETEVDNVLNEVSETTGVEFKRPVVPNLSFWCFISGATNITSLEFREPSGEIAEKHDIDADGKEVTMEFLEENLLTFARLEFEFSEGNIGVKTDGSILSFTRDEVSFPVKEKIIQRFEKFVIDGQHASNALPE